MKIIVGNQSVEVQRHPVFSYYVASKDGKVFTRPCVPNVGGTRTGPRPRADYWKEVSMFIVKAKHTPPYQKCRVTQDGKTRLVSVHRFILECWEGVKPRNIITRHMDGNPLNNAISNLKYGTVQENVQDAFKHTGNYAEGEKNGRAVLNANDVHAIRNRFDSGEKIASIHKDYPHVTKETVGYAARRTTWSHI